MKWNNPYRVGIKKKDMVKIFSHIEGIIDLFSKFYEEPLDHILETEILAIEIALQFFSCCHSRTKILSNLYLPRHILLIVILAMGFEEDDAMVTYSDVTEIIDLKKFSPEKWLNIKLDILKCIKWNIPYLHYKNLTSEEMKKYLTAIKTDPLLLSYDPFKRVSIIIKNQ